MMLHPLICTNLTRTVIDIARSCTFAQGVVVGDAGLRRLAASGRVEAHRAELVKQLKELPTASGHSRAERVLNFLDAGAESPLETLYRLQFSRLGFKVRTQVQIPSRSGSNYRVDFELEGHQVYFEADGKAKYLDDKFRKGKSLDERLLDEKRREDWIRGSTGYRVIRGGWNDALTPEATARLLRSFSVIPPLGSKHGANLELY